MKYRTLIRHVSDTKTEYRAQRSHLLFWWKDIEHTSYGFYYSALQPKTYLTLAEAKHAIEKDIKNRATPTVRQRKWSTLP